MSDDQPTGGLGCPDTFEPYEQHGGTPVLGHVLISTSMLVRADSLLSAFLAGRVVSLTTVMPPVLEEARILAAAFRSATASAGR